MKQPRLNILVVDDPSPVRQLTMHLLREQGWPIQSTVHPQQGLAVLQSQHVALICCSAKTAASNGGWLIEQIQTQYPSLPLLVLADADDQERMTALLRQTAFHSINTKELEQRLVPVVHKLLALQAATPSTNIESAGTEHVKIDLVLDNDRTKVPDVIRQLLDHAETLGTINAGERIRVSVALEEAIINAIVHGNLEVSSQLKEQDDSAFEKLLDIRAAHPTYGERRVNLSGEITPDELTLTIGDEGPGFDRTLIPDPTDPKNLDKPSGRGIMLMRAFLDEVRFDEQGNKVTLVLRRLRQSVTAPSNAL